MIRVVHCRREPYDLYIGRANPSIGEYEDSEWANKFIVGVHGTRAEVIEKYEAYLTTQPDLMAKLHTLEGLVLGCWCKPKACHGDVIKKFVESLNA